MQDVSFTIFEGETLGLVGESGCGKPTIGRLVLGLLAPSAGVVRYRDTPVPSTPGCVEWIALRREMQMVFQDPFGALNPRLTIGWQIREVLDTHGIGALKEREHQVKALLKAVGLESHMMTRYPHQISGGQLQRIVISRALAVSPSFLVCDEPVSALDVSIQAQVINLLQDLQEGAKSHLSLHFARSQHRPAYLRSDRRDVSWAFGRERSCRRSFRHAETPLHACVDRGRA